MTRIKAVSLFLAAVLILTLTFAILIAIGFQSSWVVTITQESSISLTVGVTAPAEPSVILASNCDGCSGGGSGG